MINALCISGFTEKVGDDSAFWDIADALEEIGPVNVKRRQWDTLIPGDLEGVDLVVAYSYGVAALWHAMYAIPEYERPTIRKVFKIVGVPRFLFSQTYGTVWTEPSNILSATAFNLHGVIPASCGIHNATAPDVALADLPTAPATKYMNVTCDGPGIDHNTIQGLPQIRDAICTYATALVSAISSGAA